ncbi:hypothetical protein Sarmat_00297 [Rickettsiales endosymbiont of Paramecium tredecaurelia]|nr:hypothetical protein [Candidatus Sarmatiella mevalonica]
MKVYVNCNILVTIYPIVDKIYINKILMYNACIVFSNNVIAESNMQGISGERWKFACVCFVLNC